MNVCLKRNWRIYVYAHEQLNICNKILRLNLIKKGNEKNLR